MLLAAVEHLDIDVPGVRGPADVGQVAVQAEVIHVGIYRFPCGEVVDSEADSLGVHAVHRVAYVHERACPRGDVQKGEFGHQALVLAVEGEPAPVRRPEYAAVYPEFVPADALAVNYCRIVAYGNRAPVSPGIFDVEASSFADGVERIVILLTEADFVHHPVIRLAIFLRK